tara:strand:- start:210 stop:1931 length:1722 start_codon:yes stop_codon:yes gene_type:complete
MAVILNKGRITSTPSIVDRSTYTRPSDWTDLPALSQGDEKVYLLVNVGEKGGDYMQLKFAGDYTVDWGDGTANTNHSSGTEADHEFLWANAPSSSLTSQGFRQVVVTITAQSGSQLTIWSLNTSPYVPTGTTYNGSVNHGVCRVKMAGTNFTDISSALRFYKGLKEFEYIGTNNVTNVSHMFNTCSSLVKVGSFDTSNIQNLTNLFNGCTNLIEVPQFDLSSATDITYMFNNCANLYKVPKMTLPSTVTSLQYTFKSCSNLQEVPFTNLNHVTNFYAAFSATSIREFNFSLDSATNIDQMFYQAFSLQTVKFHNIPVGQLTNIGYVFGHCYSLTHIKPFDTSNVSNFRNCYSYLKFDLDLSWTDTSNGANFESMFEGNKAITDASWLDITSSATNVIELFNGCNRLEKYPTLDFTNITNLQATFAGNRLMVTLPTINNTNSITACQRTFQSCYLLQEALPLSGALTTVREMYLSCYSLISIPAYDLSSIVAYPNSYRMAYQAHGLKESLITTHKSQVSYANCGLSRSAIVDIFNNLATNADGRTIYVAANPESNLLTASDLLIATNKGWTVSS